MRLLVVAASSSIITALAILHPEVVNLHAMQSYAEEGMSAVMDMVRSFHH